MSRFSYDVKNKDFRGLCWIFWDEIDSGSCVVDADQIFVKKAATLLRGFH